MKKITDPTRRVQDSFEARHFNKLGIDLDYVEMVSDYGKYRKGKLPSACSSPHMRTYRDRKKARYYSFFDALPHCKKEGNKIDVGWLYARGKYYSKSNIFTAIVTGTEVKVTALYDQPGISKHDSVTYDPVLVVGDVVWQALSSATLLTVDPINENYQNNTLEWDYGICKRRLRIIEGHIREWWVFDSDPGDKVTVIHNFMGKLRLNIGSAVDANNEHLPVKVSGDWEIVDSMAGAKFPVRVGTDYTFYPGVGAADGEVRRAGVTESWEGIISSAGTHAFPSETSGDAFYWKGNSNPNYSGNTHSIFSFDTMPLPNVAIISLATFSIRAFAKNDPGSNSPQMCLVGATPDDPSTLIASDYLQLGTTEYATAIAYAAVDTTDYNDYALNATGIAAINLWAITSFGVREKVYDNDYDFVAHTPVPTWNINATNVAIYFTETGAGYQPKLVVSYYITGLVGIDDNTEYFRYTDSSGVLREFTGSDSGANCDAGLIGISGTKWRWGTYLGNRFELEGTALGTTGTPKLFWVSSNDFRYNDDNGDTRWITGAIV